MMFVKSYGGEEKVKSTNLVKDLSIFGGAYRTTPELTSRGTNFRFARTWAVWVWQLATGGAAW